MARTFLGHVLECRAMRRLLVSLVAFATLVFPQGTQHPSNPTAALAKRYQAGTFHARIFPDSAKINFVLATSWIPGEKHKGMLRYQVSAYPERPSASRTVAADDYSKIENLINRVDSCAITIDLYDADNFLLRKIPVHFISGVDDEGHILSLSANDAEQMDAQDYRAFLAGGWNVEWACPTSGQP